MPKAGLYGLQSGESGMGGPGSMSCVEGDHLENLAAVDVVDHAHPAAPLGHSGRPSPARV